ncbi:MAG: hypothetical protein ACK5AZ_06870 [Bryobacteraceae bacterium]
MSGAAFFVGLAALAAFLSGVRSVATVETVVYAVLRDVFSVVASGLIAALIPLNRRDLSFVYGASVPIVVLLIMIVLRGAPF